MGRRTRLSFCLLPLLVLLCLLSRLSGNPAGGCSARCLIEWVWTCTLGLWWLGIFNLHHYLSRSWLFLTLLKLSSLYLSV